MTAPVVTGTRVVPVAGGDGAVAMRCLVPDRRFDPERPCLVRDLTGSG